MSIETTNEDRVEWAAESLERYAEMTRYNDNDREWDEIVRDLLGDLMHFCDAKQIDFSAELTLATGNYEEEKAEEAEREARLVAEANAKTTPVVWTPAMAGTVFRTLLPGAVIEVRQFEKERWAYEVIFVEAGTTMWGTTKNGMESAKAKALAAYKQGGD